MSKRNYKFGGNVHETVPASRQNIEQRTPSGVRPVSSPVVPVVGVSGKMRNGGEVKNMKKPKKMAFGGPAGPMPNGASNMPMSNMSPVPNPYPMSPMTGSMNQMGVMPRAPAMKKGGKVNASTYNDMTGGAGGGIGRLEKTSIASKAKVPKMKTGGKVKGYANGGPMSFDEIMDWNRKNNKGFKEPSAEYLARARADFDKSRAAETPEYRARRAAADKRVRNAKGRPKSGEPTYASQRAAQPGPDVDVYGDAARNRGKGGGPRGNPTTGGEAQARAMGLYPFGPESINVDTARDAQYAKDNRGKSGGRGGPASGGEAQMRSMNIYPFGSESPSVGGTTGLKTPMTYGDSERGNGPGPNPKKKRSALDKALFGLGLDNMGNEIREYGRTHDYAGRPIPTGARSGKIDKPDGSGGMTGRLKKGGKVEAFEGSAKDMAQDKKLAKKRGMSLKAWEKSSADEKHDKQRSMKGLKKGGVTCGGMAMGGGVSTAQDGMKPALRPKPTAMAKGGKVGMTFGKPLPGTKLSSQKIRATTATGASMKKDGMKGQLRAKASGAKPTKMMKPLGMTKMASGGKVRGTGCAQRGTKFIGEV